jgi:hypothetical protein
MRHAQRDQQDVLVTAVRRAVDDDALQRVAQREHARHHQRQRQVGVDAEVRLSRYTAYSATISAAPCAKLMMCSTP